MGTIGGVCSLRSAVYFVNCLTIEVHLLVINELQVTRKNYGWLSFAEGRKYAEYQGKLVEEIAQDREEYQTYFGLLTQLEEEGKERMASDVMLKYFLKMPPQKQVQFLTEEINQLEEEGKERVASDVMLKYFSKMPVEKQVQFIREEIVQLEEEGNGKMAYEIMQKFFSKMPMEKQVQLIKEGITQLEEEENGIMAYEIMQKFFSKMPLGKRAQLIKELILPDEDLQKTFAELPPEKLQKIREIVLKLSPKQN